MVIFRKGGGGAFRRYFGLRQRLLRDSLNDDRPLKGPVSLFDFRSPDDAADLRNSISDETRWGIFGGWRVSDDSVIGGYSTSKLKFIDSSCKFRIGDADNASVSRPPGGMADDETNRKEASSGLWNWLGNKLLNGENRMEKEGFKIEEKASPPFLRWSGSISTEVGRSNKARNVARSGFAAVLSPDYPFGAPIENRYNALEICCRTDGRTYAVNLHVESYFPDDIYQGFIAVPAHPDSLDSLEGAHVNSNSSSKDGAPELTDQDRGNAISDVKGSETADLSASSETSSTREDDTMADLACHIQKESSEVNAVDNDVRSYIKSREMEFTVSETKEDQYFGYPPKGFVRLIMPFRNFVLTARGRMRHTQRELDGAIRIESIGFTLMDGKEGPFALDLVSIRAVNLLSNEVVGAREERADNDANVSSQDKTLTNS